MENELRRTPVERSVASLLPLPLGNRRNQTGQSANGHPPHWGGTWGLTPVRRIRGMLPYRSFCAARCLRFFS